MKVAESRRVSSDVGLQARVALATPLPSELDAGAQVEHLLAHGVLAACTAAELRGLRLRDLPSPPSDLLRAFVEADYRVLGRAANDGEREFVDDMIGMVEEGHLIEAWWTRREVAGEPARASWPPPPRRSLPW